MLIASSLRIARSIPRTSNALGSPEGLTKTGFIVVPGTMPKSKILLLISPTTI